MFDAIQSFDSVQLMQDCLVVIDIDETVLRYKYDASHYIGAEWWKMRFEYHYKLSGDYDAAEKSAYNEWHEIISTTQPEHTDVAGFMRLIERVDCMSGIIIFLTARRGDDWLITETHLKQLSVPRYVIHYTDDGPKGKMLCDIISSNYPGVLNIMIIDDLESNLMDVEEHVKNAKKNVYCYKFEKL
jgi:hypothetical protein